MKYTILQLIRLWLFTRPASHWYVNTLFHVGGFKVHYKKLATFDQITPRSILAEIQFFYGKIKYITEHEVAQVLSPARSKRWKNNILFINKNDVQYVRFVFFDESSIQKRISTEDIAHEAKIVDYPVTSDEKICRDQNTGTAIFIRM